MKRLAKGWDEGPMRLDAAGEGSHLFKEQIGVALNYYRNSVRLRAFMEHYRTPPKKTILECVYAAGFGSYAQFYKVFTQSFGHGPREYLRE